MLEILWLLLADDYELSTSATRELSLRKTMAMELTYIMDVYCGRLIEIRALLEVTEIAHHSFLGLCRKGINTLCKDDTDINTLVEGQCHNIHKCICLPTLDLPQ